MQEGANNSYNTVQLVSYTVPAAPVMFWRSVYGTVIKY